MNIKACVSTKKRRKGSVSMWVIIVLCVIALALVVYNIIMSNYWYVACYLLGIILGVSYILVCLNELYSTWIMTDGENLIMQCWDNCFFPYQTLTNFKLIGEFLPAKNVRLRIPIKEIKQIYIGTKAFVKRNTNDERFLNAVALYENTKYNSNQRLLEKADILFIGTTDGDSLFMNISHFNERNVIKILSVIKRIDSDIEIKASGRGYRSFTGERS